MANERCIIYCRVSSERQATEDKTSLESQEKFCREACAERGYEIVGVYKEVISRSINERPHLNQVRGRIANGEADILMSSVLDRLTGDQRHDYILMEEVERHKARVEFALEAYDDTAMGRFLRAVRAFMAEVELERLSFRVQQGINAKILAGEPMGTLPLGYKKDEEGNVVIEPVGAKTVQRIFELYASGTSLYGIQQILQEEGHLTLRGKAEWSTAGIHRIIAGPGAPKYIGRWQGGQWGQSREKGKAAKSFLKPESEWGPVKEVPELAIVSEDLFKTANRRRLRAQAESPRRARDHEAFLLRSTRIHCGECKGPMHGISPKNEERRYYQCSTKGCRKANIANHLIDGPAWAIAKEILSDPDIMLERGLKQVEDGTLDAQIAAAQAILTAVEKDVAKTTDRYLKAPDIALPRITAQLEALETRQEVARAELAKLEVQANELARAEAIRQELAKLQDNDPAKLDDLTHPEKQTILANLGIVATINDFGTTPRWSIATGYELDLALPMDFDYEGLFATDLIAEWATEEAEGNDESNTNKPWALLSATPRP